MSDWVASQLSLRRRPSRHRGLPSKGDRNIASTRCCSPKIQVTMVHRLEDLIPDPRNHALGGNRS